MSAGKFKNIDLVPIKGFKAQNQFAPTTAQPIRMRARMGGDPVGDIYANPSEVDQATVAKLGATKVKATAERPLKGASDSILRTLAKDKPKDNWASTAREAKAELARRGR
jgi:hypothetical protein